MLSQFDVIHNYIPYIPQRLSNPLWELKYTELSHFVIFLTIFISYKCVKWQIGRILEIFIRLGNRLLGRTIYTDLYIILYIYYDV